MYNDGLSDLERTQRKSLPAFLTGSAKSQADVTAIRKDLAEVANEYYFSPYDTTWPLLVPSWISASSSKPALRKL